MPPKKAETAASEEAVMVPVADLLMWKEHQCRGETHFNTMARYASAMQAGAVFPPILVATIKGAPYVVDGWHRTKACIRAGIPTISAIVRKATAKEALVMAALANQDHGLPLKPKERRVAFRRFIKGQGNVDLKTGALMSYRQIAAALGNSTRHTTISNWVALDFPNLAETMGTPAPYLKEDDDAPDPEGYNLDRALEDLGAVVRHARGVHSKRGRGRVVRALRAALKGVEEGAPWDNKDRDMF
jgi:hypothetical protein